MANKPCTCGSEAIPGKPPEIIIRLRDIQRGNFAIGNLLPLSHSPIFLSLASDFCASSPRSNYAPPSGLSSYLFNREINRVWGERCRCKRETGTWRLTAEWFFRGKTNPNLNRDYTTTSQYLGAAVNLRISTTTVSNTVRKIQILGFLAASNYSTEVEVMRSEQDMAFASAFELKSYTQTLIIPGCPGIPPNPPTPSPPIAYPSIPRSPFPSEPPIAYLPELPPKKRVGMPAKPVEDDCCECC